MPTIEYMFIEHKINPHTWSISQIKLYFTDWGLFKYIYKLTSIDLPLVEHQWNPICGQYQRQALLYFMVMNSKIFINCQAFNSPLLGIKKISIPIEYHKTKCILLLGNLFQSIYKLASIDLRLVEHQCNLHLCSISQNKLYFTARKIIPIYF